MKKENEVWAFLSEVTGSSQVNKIMRSCQSEVFGGSWTRPGHVITATLVTHQHSEHSQNASTLSNLFEGCVQENGLKLRIPIEIDVENNRVGADFGSDAAVN